MGIAISQIIPSEAIRIEDLKGKTLAVDGYNMLYQFLTTIRGPDGSPLTDNNGQVTSHLVGLFSRVTNFLGQGIKLIFVFDGKVPEMKKQELQRRKALKEEARIQYETAKASGDIDQMKKYAGRTASLTREMVEQSKELLDALGVPWIDAPSEGEAQAAALVKQGHAWAVVSQDADALLYESPRIVKNLAISGRRKMPGKMTYVTVDPEMIEHKKVLADLGLDNSQLRALALLIGTDYNIGGVKGIGPKKGLKAVQEHDHDFSALFTEMLWSEYWDVSWEEILDIFENMPTVEPERIVFGKPDVAKVEALLIGKFGFSRERVESSMKRLASSQGLAQRGLGEFF